MQKLINTKQFRFFCAWNRQKEYNIGDKEIKNITDYVKDSARRGQDMKRLIQELDLCP